MSRNAPDFIVLLPGVNTTDNDNRGSTIAGPPQSMINITIDGVNSQDNYNRTSEGFFSRVRRSLDAIEEVTVSTATPGSESAGQGAVQIRLVTRSGNNELHGSLYEYHRNPVLDANCWFNNRDLAPDPKTGKSPRDRILLNQFGGRAGGPIWFPKALFGPPGFDGRDRAFFLVNLEESCQPNQVTRNQTIVVPEAEQGNFVYTDASIDTVRSVNLFDLAASKGQLSTPDPTIKKLLADIRESTECASCGLNPQTNPLYQTLTFVNKGMARTRFLTSRFDFNLTSKHRLEISHNHHKYFPLPYDNTNNGSPAYPNFPNYRVQGGNRLMGSLTLRSTITPRLVDEFRAGLSGGSTLFSPNISPADFSGSLANQDGYALGLSAAGISNACRHYTPSRRNAPTRVVEDTVTWTKGSHGLSSGVNTSYDPERVLFDSTNGRCGSGPLRHAPASRWGTPCMRPAARPRQ